jgi:hypothetical protein
MYNYANCQGCGKKLRDAFWCRPCELTFCSIRCLEAHLAEHHLLPVSSSRPRGVMRRLPTDGLDDVNKRLAGWERKSS